MYKIIEVIVAALCILAIIFTCAPTAHSSASVAVAYRDTLEYSSSNGLDIAYSLMGHELLSDSGDPLMEDIEHTVEGTSVNYLWVRSDKKTPVTITETTVTSTFPKRSGGAWHNGTDLDTPISDKEPCWQVALWPGTVVKAEVNSSYGKTVVIDHGNGFFTRYAHMGFGNATSAGGRPLFWETTVKTEMGISNNSSLQVKVGDHVSAGQILGTLGTTGSSTGPHAHIELMICPSGHYTYACWRADVWDYLKNGKPLSELKWYYGTKADGFSTKQNDGMAMKIPGISSDIFSGMD